ncbi:MAG TPA: DnaJ domain-containing protein [Hyphomicrobiales bacterium]|nr:DnaJ domain-containing protein [Kaistiaceae bacterium]HQF30188.1 DnaJ domain-containing protein [Hyphomicrobiales bacterium]
MKLDSKFFDRIRIKPDQETIEAGAFPRCEWAGCEHPAPHRAPKGRLREGQYYNFCLDHVRIYNKSYNYFAGMDDGSIADFQKSSLTGHRPTWRMGTGGQATEHEPQDYSQYDPFSFFSGARRQQQRRPEQPKRRLQKVARRSFETLALAEDATGPEIKARYKELVKRLHPDANGGDRKFEDRLREIIQAYNQLKSAGYC